MDINHITLMGRITADPELKITTDGTQVVSFTLAVNKYTKKDHPEADFIDCVAWKNTATIISSYAKKGSRLVVEGELHTRNWEDKEGKKRKSTEVTVNKVVLLDKKSDSEQVHTETSGYASSKPEPDFKEVETDEDFPF